MEGRIDEVHRSKEKLTMAMKQDRDSKMAKTQRRFHNNMRSFKVRFLK